MNATDAFVSIYNHLDKGGEIVESRIGRTKHLTNVTICVKDPYQNVCLDKTRNLSLRYLLGEIDWYLRGSNLVSEIGKYGKMWYDLTDDGKTVNSAYGYTIFEGVGFDQLEYCIEKLKKNKYDRQAIIHLKTPTDKPTKDVPCTSTLQFIYFDGKLNLHTYMRSNDIWYGLPYDIAFFMILLQIVCKRCNFEIGEYNHTVGDIHLYEKHWNKNVEFSDHTECWFYDECFDELKAFLNEEMSMSDALSELRRINNENSLY